MAKLPLVSIITPSYNQAKYLEITMQSVLSQDYPNIEYLVVDGGSSDGSVEIIKQHEKNLAWWISEPDHGQADAINKGMQRAKGDIIAWLNSDDIYQLGAVRLAVQELMENRKLGFVYGDVLTVDGRGKAIKHIRYRDWGLEGLMCFNIIGQPAVFMRREILEKSDFLDLSYQYLLDHQLWLRLAAIAPIKYLPRLLASAHYHLEAKNVASAENFGEEAYRIVAWMQTYPLLKERFAKIRKKIWAGAHRINARYLLDGGKPLASLKAYWKSLQSYPPIALKEWKRMLFAALAALGIVNPDLLIKRWQ